ncbi:MAG: hypothetical protein WDO24_08820 [Pseudomonadota bacterium]
MIEIADRDSVALDGFDYALWQIPNQPSMWRYRTARKGDDIWSVISPDANAPISDWVEAIRDQLGGLPQPGSAEP